MSNTVTTIIPVHKLEENEKDYFAKAIASIREQKKLPTKVMVVVPKDSEVKKTLESFDYGDKVKSILSIVENEGETDFCSQINFGVSKVETEWFSILEFDDEYSKIMFDNFYKYSNYYDEVEVFLPIVLDANVDGKFIHFSNEPVWAKDFSDKLGFLDNDALLNYPQFQISGGVYKKEAFDTVGGLKPGIKLQFAYEFLLRMTYYDKKVMTIPKVGYKKTNMRPSALFYGYYMGENKLRPDEAKWWFNQAKKECYFKQDRGITYEEEITQ
tara:strand:+ start:1886 stop:2695 length:810 start_codon:yes stop_codon:yes gene_type:complete